MHLFGGWGVLRKNCGGAAFDRFAGGGRWFRLAIFSNFSGVAVAQRLRKNSRPSLQAPPSSTRSPRRQDSPPPFTGTRTDPAVSPKAFVNPHQRRRIRDDAPLGNGPASCVLIAGPTFLSRLRSADDEQGTGSATRVSKGPTSTVRGRHRQNLGLRRPCGCALGNPRSQVGNVLSYCNFALSHRPENLPR